MRSLAVLLLAGAVLALFTSIVVPFILLFGGLSFLPRIAYVFDFDLPMVVVGCAVLVLVGIHGVGRRWLKKVSAAEGEVGRRWKFRWSLAVVGMICLLFAAGASLVGIGRNFVWPLRSDEPVSTDVLEFPGHRPENNLQGIGIALVGYSDSSAGLLPPGPKLDRNNVVRQSWALPLLPFLDYSSKGIDFSRPWNDPRNARYFQSVIPQFINTSLGAPPVRDGNGYGLIHYAANSHVVAGNRAMRCQDVTDGLSNTFFAGEVNARFKPWGHPVNSRDPTRGINRSPYGFGGAAGAGGANFVMADGSVRFVSERVSPAVLRALSTPRGGEGIGADALGP